MSQDAKRLHGLRDRSRLLHSKIGGPDILTYRRMIELVAEQRGKNPFLLTVPFLTPKLSSYGCAITTSVPMATAQL